MKKILLLLMLFGACLVSFSQEKSTKIFQKYPILTEDIVIFPITLINAFPFISGEVNGIKGKFMFDTGNVHAIDINENYVSLPDRKTNGNGKVGSGQEFKVSINEHIAEVKLINGYTYHNLENVKSGNYDFLQKAITPDVLGYIGHNFFKGYLVKLDYLRRRIIFYKNTKERQSSKDFLLNEKVLAIIDFETRKLPNHPLIKVKVGEVNLIGAWDTGQYGSVELEKDAEETLIKKSLLIPSGNDAFGDNIVQIKEIVLDGKFKTDLSGVYIESRSEGNEHVRKALSITEENMLDIGYRFFEQYKTIWDYDAKKIYILEK